MSNYYQYITSIEFITVLVIYWCDDIRCVIQVHELVVYTGSLRMVKEIITQRKFFYITMYVKLCICCPIGTPTGSSISVLRTGR